MISSSQRRERRGAFSEHRRGAGPPIVLLMDQHGRSIVTAASSRVTA